MRYQVEVTIDLPRKDVLALFQDKDFIPKWQEGFISLTTLKGDPGELDSVNQLIYDSRGKEMVMQETILEKKLPDTMHFLYEAKNVENWAYNYFTETDGKTLWKADHTFKFAGFMTLIGLIGKKAFVGETTKTMKAFKTAAEQEKRSLSK